MPRPFAFVLLALLVACAEWPSGKVPPATRVRTTKSPPASTVTLANETRPVFPPARAMHVVELAGGARPMTLVLGVGLTGTGATGAWHLTAALESLGAPPLPLVDVLLDPAKNEGGRWHDERITLSASDIRGRRLVLRAAPVGKGPHPRRPAWSHPLVLPTEPERLPSVILVSLDTLRADRVGPRRDGTPSRTPHLDAFAETAVRYTDAYSPSTWTDPSHSSLLWGRHPAAQERLRAAHGRPDAAADIGPLAPLAEMFRDTGWLTAAFTGGGFMSPQLGLAPGHGFARAFDRYRAYAVPKAVPGSCAPSRLDGATVFDWAGEWIREHAGQPFLLFVHTYEPHDRCPIIPSGGAPWAQWTDFDAARMARFDAHYDELIARADQLVGRLLDTVAAAGIADDTVIVVTSDHGEALFEHGGGGHGCPLRPYEELVRVPLLVRAGTRAAPGVVTAPVGLVQVLPTLLALAGIADDVPRDGRPLPGLGIPGGAAADAVFVHCGDHLAIRRGDHKLLTTRAGTEPDLTFDLAADPDERHPLDAPPPAVAAALRADADAYWRTTNPAGTPSMSPDVAPETREQLRALGYVE